MENQNKHDYEEKQLSPMSGFSVLFGSLLLFAASTAAFVWACVALSGGRGGAFAVTVIIVTSVYVLLVFPICLSGLKVINPNEAAVYVLFGKYYGTIVKPGFFFINPFCGMINPTAVTYIQAAQAGHNTGAAGQTENTNVTLTRDKKVSLKIMTLNNERQKINDKEGNPIDIGVVVIWRVFNATKAVFAVDNYKAYVSTQCDAAIRNVTRQYPYDISDDGDERSLRGSSNEIAEELKRELQKRVSAAGIEIIETRIAHLAYAQEIAAAMLQRQQADAVIAARQKIVDGAVGMVEMALKRLSENGIVALDDERRAVMVSNLMVVLCGNKDAQPVINSGTLY